MNIYSIQYFPGKLLILIIFQFQINSIVEEHPKIVQVTWNQKLVIRCYPVFIIGLYNWRTGFTRYPLIPRNEKVDSCFKLSTSQILTKKLLIRKVPGCTGFLIWIWLKKWNKNWIIIEEDTKLEFKWEMNNWYYWY